MMSRPRLISLSAVTGVIRLMVGHHPSIPGTQEGPIILGTPVGMIPGTVGIALGITVAGIIGDGGIILGTTVVGIHPIIGVGATTMVGTTGVGMATTMLDGTGLIVQD